MASVPSTNEQCLELCFHTDGRPPWSNTFRLVCQAVRAQDVDNYRIAVATFDDSRDDVRAILDEYGLSARSRLVSTVRRADAIYNANVMRNCVLRGSQGWCAVLDADIAPARNFVRRLTQHVFAYPDSQRSVFTFLHCAYEEPIEDLDAALEEARAYVDSCVIAFEPVSRLTNRSMWYDRIVSATKRRPRMRFPRVGNVANYWGHPLTRVTEDYYPHEFYFVAHSELLRALGFFDEQFAGRGSDKVSFNLLLYYLFDLKMIVLDTVVSTFVMHVWHDRPKQHEWFGNARAYESKTFKQLRRSLLDETTFFRPLKGFLEWQLEKADGNSTRR